MRCNLWWSHSFTYCSNGVDFEQPQDTPLFLYCRSVGVSLSIQQARLRQRPDIVIATPGLLVDHIQNSHSFDLETIEVCPYLVFASVCSSQLSGLSTRV